MMYFPSRPPPPPTPSPGAVLYHAFTLFQHNQKSTLLGGESGTAELGSYNNFPKLLKEVDYEFKNT